jgi:hypothetical protein
MTAIVAAKVLAGITGAKRVMLRSTRARRHSSGSATMESVKLAFIVVPLEGKVVPGFAPPESGEDT